MVRARVLVLLTLIVALGGGLRAWHAAHPTTLYQSADELSYGKLALDLARSAVPFVVYSNGSTHDFFSARTGCQTYGFYGLDLAALCIRPPTT